MRFMKFRGVGVILHLRSLVAGERGAGERLAEGCEFCLPASTGFESVCDAFLAAGAAESREWAPVEASKWRQRVGTQQNGARESVAEGWKMNAEGEKEKNRRTTLMPPEVNN